MKYPNINKFFTLSDGVTYNPETDPVIKDDLYDLFCTAHPTPVAEGEIPSLKDRILENCLIVFEDFLFNTYSSPYSKPNMYAGMKKLHRCLYFLVISRAWMMSEYFNVSPEELQELKLTHNFSITIPIESMKSGSMNLELRLIPKDLLRTVYGQKYPLVTLL